jgi:hypothetical protein
MIEQRRLELRRRYITLSDEYDHIADGYSCGQQLAEAINPRLGEIRREIDGIIAEVSRSQMCITRG